MLVFSIQIIFYLQSELVFISYPEIMCRITCNLRIKPSLNCILISVLLTKLNSILTSSQNLSCTYMHYYHVYTSLLLTLSFTLISYSYLHYDALKSLYLNIEHGQEQFIYFYLFIPNKTS